MKTCPSYRESLPPFPHPDKFLLERVGSFRAEPPFPPPLSSGSGNRNIEREREGEREGPAVETFPSADSGTMEERFIYRILDLGHLNRRRKTWIGVPPPRFAEGDGNERRWVPMETTNLFTVLIVSVLRSFFPTYRVQMKRGERRRERRRRRTRGKQPRRKKEKYRRGGWQSPR